MDFLGQIGSWIAANESLLSGIAALIVVAGVIFTPIGVGLRRFVGSASGKDAGGSGRDARVTPRRAANDAKPITYESLMAHGSHATKFARSGEVRIAYNERGTGPPHIVLAPGIVSHLHVVENLPSSRRMLDRFERFAHVVNFDKRGQGLSDPTMAPPTLEERSDDIRAVMDAAGLDRAILVGVSEGGPMCLYFADQHPERVQGLILLGTTARWTQGDDFPLGVSRRALETLPARWGTGVLRDVFFPGVSRDVMSDDTYRAFEHIMLDRQGAKQLVEMMLATDVRDILPRIEVPTLVTHFTGDLAVPIRLGRLLAEGIPNAEFLEINAVDHADLARSPEAMDRVEAFCRQVAAADPGRREARPGSEALPS